jgi:hypothetical protein
MMANFWRVIWKYLAKIFYDGQLLEGFLEISRQSFPWYPKFGDLSRQKILWWLADSVYYASQNFDGKLVQKHPDKFQRQPNFGKIWFNFA